MPNPITWDENAYPTPQQWLEWLKTHDYEGQLDIAENMIIRLGVFAGEYMRAEKLQDQMHGLQLEIRGAVTELKKLGQGWGYPPPLVEVIQKLEKLEPPSGEEKL